MTLYLECSGSGTEDKESQPMPTRPKGIESAAHERSDDGDIRTYGLSGGCGKGTATAVRGARTRKRGAFLLTSAAPDSGGLFGQAHSMTVFQRTDTASYT